MRFLIADDHTLFCEGLRRVIESQEGWSVEGVARTGRQAVEMALELQPDVVLMDISLPEMDGLEAAATLKRCGAPCRVVILTMHADPLYRGRAQEVGVDGYLLKDLSLEEFVEQLRSLLHPSPPEPRPVLSPREVEVLRLVARGLRNREIAQRLLVSEHTVRNHLTNIYQKLRCNNRAEAVSKFLGMR